MSLEDLEVFDEAKKLRTAKAPELENMAAMAQPQKQSLHSRKEKTSSHAAAQCKREQPPCCKGKGMRNYVSMCFNGIHE